MRWPSTALLVPLFFALFANATQVGYPHHHYSGVEERNDTARLFRRVRTGPGSGRFDPKKAEDLFLFDDGPGGCRSRESTLDTWVEEAMALHTAIERLYANTKGDRSKLLLWQTWFGVQIDMRIRDVDLSNTANKELWETIGDGVARVGRFLSEGGLYNPQVPGQKPRVFCGPQSGTLQSWSNSVVRDKDGQNVVVFEDPNTDYKQYLILGDAFPEFAHEPNSRAFWMDAFNGYDIDRKGADTLCPGKRYAKTARHPSSWPTVYTRGAEVEFGKANRHILFCPIAFAPGEGSHSYPSLARAVDEDHYPIAGRGDPRTSLGRMLTMSATLYHELYHLTDADSPDADETYNLEDMLDYAEDSDTRTLISRNPETYAYVAMAAYLFFNAPEDEENCLYLGGFPKEASKPFV